MGQGAAVSAAAGWLRRDWLAAVAGLSLMGCGKDTPPPAGGLAGSHPERGHLLRQLPAIKDWTPRRTRVVIAGAGIAGLAAARALHQAGIEDLVLLDLEDEAGGNSRGGRIAGLDCPLGAHYLPVPTGEAGPVHDLLEEFGLRRRVAGRWTWDERHLCHSPQERLFFRGAWQDGLLPVQDVHPATLAQYVGFARRIEALSREARYTLPAADAPLRPGQLALDALSFADWLGHEGFDDPLLRWYLDYCCRDDYGAPADVVSAWAGVHYFASRHGFHAPGEGAERDGVLTWPEGNAWLARRLAAPLGGRLRTGRVVTRIAATRHGVEVDALDATGRSGERWRAAHVVVALPLFVAARVVQDPPAALLHAARGLQHAPWVVANLQLRQPLRDRPGAAPAWDNVVQGAAGLGYVDARHQALDPRPGPTVLTWYHAPGVAARPEVLQADWRHWLATALGDLIPAHPDLASAIAQVQVTRYGHAMRIPVPGTRAALREGPPQGPRLSFAHADWAGYSVFEEAFSAGHAAGRHVARVLRAHG